MTDAGNGAPTPRGGYAKGRRRREAIVAAALGVFARTGYHSAAMAGIAREAGLTLPGLLHHFPSKVELLLAVLERRDAETDRLLPAKGAGDADWRGLLRGLVAVARHNEGTPGVVRAFAMLSVESLGEGHPAADWFRARTETTRARIAHSLTRGMAEGAVAPDTDPAAIASEIIAMMDGLQEQWLRAEGALDMAGIFEGYVERLIADIDR